MTHDVLKKIEKINAKTKQISKKRKFMYGCFVPNPKTTVMFVAEMPSFSKEWNPKWGPRANFNVSYTDQKFMQALVKHGFGGCYITDLVKTCAKPRRPTEDEKKEWKPILKKEIKIIKPCLVVALGESAFNAVRDYKLKEFYKSEYLYHPTTWNWPGMRPEYIRRIRRLAKYCHKRKFF